MNGFQRAIEILELEAGGPGSGRHPEEGFVTLYHGTTLRRAIKITREGLNANKKSDWGRFTSKRKGHVYLTPDKKSARKFAGRKVVDTDRPNSSPTPAIVEFRIPTSLYNKMSTDEEDVNARGKSYGSLKYKGNIDARYAVALHKPNKSQFGEATWHNFRRWTRTNLR